MDSLTCTCGKSFKNSWGLKSHKNHCDGSGIKPRRISVWVCPKCNHEVKASRSLHFSKCDGRGPRGKRTPSVCTSGWSKGKTAETDIRVANIKSSLQKKFQSGYTRVQSSETREKLRQLALDRYANGWEVKCGRALKYTYVSPVAGTIKLDGQWELETARYLDRLGVKWKRNKTRFIYFNDIKQAESTYCPDFYVEEWHSYIEVKGYETDLDRCKWRQFPEKLLVWRKTDIETILRDH